MGRVKFRLQDDKDSFFAVEVWSVQRFFELYNVKGVWIPRYIIKLNKSNEFNYENKIQFEEDYNKIKKTIPNETKL